MICYNASLAASPASRALFSDHSSFFFDRPALVIHFRVMYDRASFLVEQYTYAVGARHMRSLGYELVRTHQ